MFKKFKKSILTALAAAITLPLILALYLLLPNKTITARAEEALTVSTAEELSAQLSASDTVAVQLTSDISSEATFTVSGVKTLDLNGYVVTFTGETGSVISVAEGAEFTLKDSNPTKENTVGDETVYGGVITGGKSDIGGGGVYVSGSFTMEGGSISGNTSTAPYYYGGGGGVHVGSNADFTMKGGSISDNKAVRENSYDATYGGGVYVNENGTFTMEGGSISGNVSKLYGGGVYVERGSFTMEDGSISGNKIANDSGYGGGVCVYDNATFTMNGGIIDKNEGNYGGGVYVAASGSKIEITDSEISGNKAYCGGGVYIANGADGTVSGGSIRNNIADGSNGGGIYVYGGTLNVDGTEISGCAANTAGGIYVDYGGTANISDVTITGCSNLIPSNNGSAICAYGSTVKLTGGEISGNYDGAAIFWVGPEFTISGAPYIYGNEDGDIALGSTRYTIENLDEGAKIGITGTHPSEDGVFTTGGGITEDNVKCFCSNDEKCITVQEGGEASVSSDTHVYAEPVWSWADDYTSATATFTCDNCQHVETVTASGEEITNEVTTPATCTATGETTYTATVEFNGATKTDTKPREAAALPHDYANSTKYNSDGTQHWKKCKDCTAEDTDHKENCSGGDTATCTAKAVCSTCGNEYGDFNQNNHAWGDWTVSKEATVEENGEEQRVCSHNSAHVETRQTDKLVAPDNNGGLSAGAMAGIIVACILLALLIVYVVCYFALYRRGILLKGKFFDAIYVPMNAIFGKKEQEENS